MSLEMMKETAFDTGKVRINYAEGPSSGPPLVLLHGGSAWWQDFTPIIPDLASHWHLFAPDLRGHGKSGRVAWSYGSNFKIVMDHGRERVRQWQALAGGSHPVEEIATALKDDIVRVDFRIIRFQRTARLLLFPIWYTISIY